METQHAIYNQAGPSNFAPSYPQEGRPPVQYASGRGRGHPGHRHTNYHQAQQQPFFTPGMPGAYAGYSMGVNGMNGVPVHGQYTHAQTGAAPGRRGGPSYHAGNFQAPASPALHPTHVYNPHASPYFPPAAVPGPAPMYNYQNAPPHVQHYPTAFSPPLPHPHYPFPNQPNLKSPMISPLPEHGMSSPRTWKAQQPTSPRALQVSAAPLPQQQKQMQSPAMSSNLTPSSPPTADSSPQLVAPRLVDSASPQATSPVTDNQTLLSANSPSSPKIVLPSFENEPAPQEEWVISAYRPDNPAVAFGITISPKAKPPSHIIRRAQEYTIPAYSNTPSIETTDMHAPDTRPIKKEEDITLDSSVPQNEQVSGSGTETESRASTVGDAFVAGSPLSTATSISIAPPKADVSSESESQGTSVPEPVVTCTDVDSSTRAASEIPPASTATQSSGTSSGSRKSWASLLRPDGPSSKTSLPTSSVQGFSIPASATVDSPPVSTSSEPSGKRNDLLRLLQNGPSTTSGVPQIRPRGLVNTGNMCFANAVLQTLVYTPPFFRLFTELGKYIDGTGPNATKWVGKDTPLVDATVEFLKEFKPKVKDSSRDSQEDDEDYDAIDSFIPSYVYDAMKEKSRFDNMGGGQQEDAEEFFGFFLDTLEEEMLAISKSLTDGSQAKSSGQERNSTEGDDWLEVGKKNKPVVARSAKSVDSPMTRIFGGKFRSTLKVPGQRDSVMVEDWRSLKLDIQREQVESIEDALHYISHPQPVQMSSVTKGGALVEALQQVLVDALPPILVCHLKRFLYDTTAKDVIKVHKQVTYGPELEVPSDAISPARRTAHPVKYKLFAVLYHHGSSAAGGHYTLDVLHPNHNADANAKPREGWIRIDDELVSDLRTEEVFGTDRDCAYLLFYRRIAGSYARAGQL